jgi:hypothetical protein
MRDFVANAVLLACVVGAVAIVGVVVIAGLVRGTAPEPRRVR